MIFWGNTNRRSGFPRFPGAAKWIWHLSHERKPILIPTRWISSMAAVAFPSFSLGEGPTLSMPEWQSWPATGRWPFNGPEQPIATATKLLALADSLSAKSSLCFFDFATEMARPESQRPVSHLVAQSTLRMDWPIAKCLGQEIPLWIKMSATLATKWKRL